MYIQGDHAANYRHVHTRRSCSSVGNLYLVCVGGVALGDACVSLCLLLWGIQGGICCPFYYQKFSKQQTNINNNINNNNNNNNNYTEAHNVVR